MTSTSIYQVLPLSYVYRLDNPTTGEFYFGFRKANKVPASQDLGIDYFTSSKYVEPRFDEFNYTIIQEFVDPLEAYDLEQFLIFQELKNPLMLNRRCHYGSKKRFTPSGNLVSSETRAKISSANKGKSKGPQSEEHKAKLSTANKGKSTSKQSRAKMSAAKIGIPKSEEHKAKISSANKGKSFSEETRAKISAANKGKSISEEHKVKLYAAHKGVPRSEETRAKISSANKGIPKPKPEFFSLIGNRKTYDKQNLSKYFPEFKQYY
jgi:hypothetical protein